MDPIDSYMCTFVSQLYEELSTNFQQFVQERPFTPQQDTLLSSIDSQSPKGKMFLSLLAIEAYIKHAIHLVRSCQPFVETMSMLLSGLSALHQQVDSEQARDTFDGLWADVTDMCLRSHKLFPHSPLIKMQQEIIENDSSFNHVETIYMRLRHENHTLKQQLRHSDEELISLKEKLAKIMDGDSDANQLIKIVELKEALAIKEEIIRKMDLEFQNQLEKYNVVFDAMREELEVYKNGRHDGHAVNYMDQLEVNLVKLREKSARDNILINTLKAGLYEQDNYQKPSFEQSMVRQSSYYY